MDKQFPRFVKGIMGTNPILEEDKLNIAFIGRSNVGKSSVINSLLETKNLVKSSSKPGSTKQINYFEVNRKMYFVDLPGYGYARLSKKEQEKVSKMISWFLFASEIKRLVVVVIIDAKIGIRDGDENLVKELIEANKDVIIVLNKVDKIKEDLQLERVAELKKLFPTLRIIPFSAKKDIGKGALRDLIFHL